MSPWTPAVAEDQPSLERLCQDSWPLLGSLLCTVSQRAGNGLPTGGWKVMGGVVTPVPLSWGTVREQNGGG
jgi:hypothetical protein